MNIKVWIVAAALAIVPGWLLLSGGGHDATGKTVVVIRPAAAALYDNNGAPARDDELLYGFSGTVTGPENERGEYPVRMRYGYRVRAKRRDVLPDERLPAEWRGTPAHIVAGAFADVLPAPDVKAYPPHLTLPRGAPLWTTERVGEYWKTVLHDGRHGYVSAALVRSVRTWNHDNEAENRARVSADALAYLGAPYRWGGKTPAGIDCSGLASMAYLLNGLPIHRNSAPAAGYPVALLHIPPSPRGGYDKASLARAKPGDLIYWRGHQAVYLGEGKYVHANAATSDVSVHSLIRGDADFRAEGVEPGGVPTWGTVYPREPKKLLVREFLALPTDQPRRFLFHARLDGYAPTRALLYPEGTGENKPVVEIADPGAMVYGVMDGKEKNVPAHTYGRPGTYRPVVVFFNETGWLPDGQPVTSGRVPMTNPLTVQ